MWTLASPTPRVPRNGARLSPSFHCRILKPEQREIPIAERRKAGGGIAMRKRFGFFVAVSVASALKKLCGVIDGLFRRLMIFLQLMSCSVCVRGLAVSRIFVARRERLKFQSW